MAATRNDVDRWIQTARKQGKKYIISVCDTFDHDDYPVYCRDRKEVLEKYPDYTRNMQRINEIIRVNEDGTVVENLQIGTL